MDYSLVIVLAASFNSYLCVLVSDKIFNQRL